MFRKLAAVAALVAPALAGVQEIWWNLTFVDDVNPDGLHPRRAIGVNGTWPPPPIDISSNDSLVVHAINSLDQPATLHHHGMFFNSTSWMDGAMGVSQCGIPPGQAFDYVVPINSSGQWGTYWVHAHSNGQYVDGLRSPVTIHPPKEHYTYDEEFTVVLGDWYHKEHSVLIKEFVNIANSDGVEPVPNAALIYFAQNGQYLGPMSGTSPTGAASATGFNENATLPFTPGKTYRLRIVNTSAFSAFYFWIEGHGMTLIEADGTDIQESPIDVLSITVAQRYSVLVTARNDTAKNWAIHANMDTTMFDTVPHALVYNVTSSITYNGSAPIHGVNSTTLKYLDVDDLSLVPVKVIAQYPPPTRTIELEFVFATMDDGTNHALFNGVTYNSPLVPAVFSALTLGANATIASAYGPLSFVIGHLDVVDIVIKNADAGKHPFHLHGHKPMLVGRSANYTSHDPSVNTPTLEGQANPMRRDTVQIPSGASVTMRFVADNPGVWFLHCHIEWHLEVGLAIQLVEAPLVAQKRNHMPQVLNHQCRALGLPVSGNAAGHANPADLAGLPLGPYQSADHRMEADD
ncbi:multicopper oxidase [Athelia psychrophila]|uniref:Multicopper oxidase n=1 Tax=Athelia psychrophila TaxID=1759441 RepID=A0A166DFF1_9AGAM|nr:multicopper oxidase [Fibularhizoctonia sp. CBS 109695]